MAAAKVLTSEARAPYGRPPRLIAMAPDPRTHFALFDLPVGYALDLADLARRYHELQRAVHPDRFAAGSAQDQRHAVQTAADLNQAYSILRSPLKRAQYLLQLLGIDDSAAAKVQDQALLLEQMELRERLGDIGRDPSPEHALASFERDVQRRYADAQQRFAEAYADGDLARAAAAVTALQFHAKLLHEAREFAETLDADH